MRAALRFPLWLALLVSAVLGCDRSVAPEPTDFSYQAQLEEGKWSVRVQGISVRDWPAGAEWPAGEIDVGDAGAQFDVDVPIRWIHGKLLSNGKPPVHLGERDAEQTVHFARTGGGGTWVNVKCCGEGGFEAPVFPGAYTVSVGGHNTDIPWGDYLLPQQFTVP